MHNQLSLKRGMHSLLFLRDMNWIFFHVDENFTSLSAQQVDTIIVTNPKTNITKKFERDKSNDYGKIKVYERYVHKPKNLGLERELTLLAIFADSSVFVNYAEKLTIAKMYDYYDQPSYLENKRYETAFSY